MLHSLSLLFLGVQLNRLGLLYCPTVSVHFIFNCFTFCISDWIYSIDLFSIHVKEDSVMFNLLLSPLLARTRPVLASREEGKCIFFPAGHLWDFIGKEGKESGCVVVSHVPWHQSFHLYPSYICKSFLFFPN